MSQGREFQRKLHTLAELATIFKALKNISIVELQRVEQQDQHLSVLRDKLQSFGKCLRPMIELSRHKFEERSSIPIIIGTERGFCGPINRWLRDAVETFQSSKNEPCIIVGSRLASFLDLEQHRFQVIEGAQTADDIYDVASHIMQGLGSYKGDLFKLVAQIRLVRPVQDEAQLSVVTEALLEPLSRQERDDIAAFDHYLDPTSLLNSFLEYYLKYSLLSALTASFTLESRARLTQVDSAIHTIEKTSAQLDRRLRRLRQEGITEEIETILLGDLHG